MDSFDVVKVVTALNRIADKIDYRESQIGDSILELRESVGGISEELRNLRAELESLGDVITSLLATSPAAKH